MTTSVSSTATGPKPIGTKLLIQLQADETSNYIWVPQEDLKDFLETELVIPREKVYVERLFLEQEQGKSENETQHNMR